jgi:hypothetical protein
MRIFISIILLAVGAYIFTFWLSGNHGSIRFRPQVLEDWIFMVILLICLGIPVYNGVILLILYFQKRSDRSIK